MSKTISALLAVITLFIVGLVISIIIVFDKQNIIKNSVFNQDQEIAESKKIVGEDLKIILSTDVYEYTGKEIIPDYKIYFDDKEINNNDYEVKLSDNIDVGTASITVDFDKYSTTANYKIIPSQIIISDIFKSTSSSVKIEWEKSSQVQGYRIYQKTELSDDWKQISDIGQENSTYVVNELEPATKYIFAISGYKTVDDITYSSKISRYIETITSPAIPKNVKLIPDKSAGYNVVWDIVDSAAGYEVYSIGNNNEYQLVCNIKTNSADIAQSDITNINYVVRSYLLLDDKTIYSEFSELAKETSETDVSKTSDSSAINGNSISDDSKINSKTKKIISVSNIMQYPELPTGCETTALTILLNYLGYEVDKLTIARNYLPKLDFYWEDEVYYGADFRTTFAGDPESEYSYGCYAPCITTTANLYLQSCGSAMTANDISGMSFDSLLSNYIDKEIPVLIWITSNNLHPTELTSVWTTPDGESVQWIAYEHCVVLTGYDLDNQIIYVSDPLIGNTSYDYSTIRQRYIDMGQQCVWIG